MRAEGLKRAHLLSSFPSSPPPPPHTHQRDSYIPCIFIVFPIQHSFLCSFKWMSLLKQFPSLKRSYVPCSLIWSLFLSKSSIYFVLSYLKNVPIPPKRLEGNMSKGNKCYCNINIFKGGKLIKNENNSCRNISFSSQLK